MALLDGARTASGMLVVLSLAATVDAAPACAVPGRPCPCPPYSAPCPPAVPSDPGATMPPVVPPAETVTPPAPTQPAAPAQAPSPQLFQAQAPSEAGLGELAFAQGGAGYIDPAAPQSMFRLRYDAAFNGDFSMDRAEYFYPAYRTFVTDRSGGGVIGGQDATADIDYQEVHAYLEYAFCDRFSTFVDLPFRWVDPTLTNVAGIDMPSGSGLSDVWFGFKYALIATPQDYLTFQTKFYTPTGDEGEALGVGHPSIEPGLLFQSSAGQDLTFFGEAKYWIPIDTTDISADAAQRSNIRGANGDYSSGVFQYGLGASIDVVERRTWKLQSVNEFVGWTAIDSLKGDPLSDTLARDADDDTIVNLKLGARLYKLDGGRERSSLYAGWGHALTGDIWYEDLFRLEYRVLF